MGWPIEVWAFMPIPEDRAYEYQKVYEGKSFIRAAFAMKKAKKIAGCVKLEWRS